jgi:thioredoxin
MQKDKPIYVYCRSGGRSSQAAKTMSKNGFSKVYNLLGGIGAWNKAELPLEKADSVSTKLTPSISPSDFARTLTQSRIALVDFHTQWCAPCKQMEPVIDALGTDLKGKAAILKIDVDANPEIADQYEVQGVPVFVLFVNGEEKWRHSGTISREALEERINREING